VHDLGVDIVSVTVHFSSIQDVITIITAVVFKTGQEGTIKTFRKKKKKNRIKSGKTLSESSEL